MNCLKNYFCNLKRSPFHNLFSYTLLVMSSTSAVCIWLLHDFKEASFDSRLKAEAAQTELFKSKANLLQSDVQKEREHSQFLDNLLSGDTKSYLYLKKKIQSLEDALKQCTEGSPSTAEIATVKNKEETTNSINKKLNLYTSSSQTLNLGQTFYDPKSDVVFSVTEITSNSLASGYIGFSDGKEEKFKNQPAGKRWFFTYKGIAYSIILTEVIWYRNSFAVTVSETESINK